MRAQQLAEAVDMREVAMPPLNNLADLERMIFGEELGDEPAEVAMPTRSMLDHALAYAARGWPILPLRPRGKEPLTHHGFKDATTDETQIRAWWTKSPDANIGLWCRDFVVLDVDPRHGGDVSLETLRKTVSAAYDFGTLEAKTGGGGRHYVFAAPSVRITKAKITTGLDIKSDTGYIVVAPSIHPSGQQYEWIDPDVEPAPMPDWLFRLATDGGAVETPRVQLPDVIAEGTRNDSLYKFPVLYAPETK